MKKPLIGITLNHKEDCFFTIRGNYIDSICKAGGVPVPLCYRSNNPHLAYELVDSLDGILFSGGAYLNPKLYGEEVLECCGKIFDDRDTFELELYKYAVEKDLPILGICRGIQTINVAAGGTLIQDIENYTNGKTLHSAHQQQPPYDEIAHTSNIVKDSLLHKIWQKDTISTNSMHHQAIKDLAPEFAVGAVSEDGIIEAIYSTKHNFIVGVQWHPEFLWDIADDSEKLFKTFVAAAKK